MLRALAPALFLSVSAFGQPRAGARDAGVPVVRSGATDAGVPEMVRAPVPVSVGEVATLRKDVSELRARVTELERQATRAEALGNEVERLTKRLDEVRARFEAAEERRDAAEREVAQRKAQTAQASTTVGLVLQQLAQGNAANAEWLRGAEQQYSGNAQKLVSLARAALAQGDLSAARQYLNLALLETGP